MGLNFTEDLYYNEKGYRILASNISNLIKLAKKNTK